MRADLSNALVRILKRDFEEERQANPQEKRQLGAKLLPSRMEISKSAVHSCSKRR